MAVWSHNKLRSIKSAQEDADRINGRGNFFIPYSTDGYKRRQCKKCKSIFYTSMITKYRAVMYHKTGVMKICPKCDPCERDWKRMGTDYDDEIYRKRCEEHGVKITKV